jgi:hypothetical protein
LRNQKPCKDAQDKGVSERNRASWQPMTFTSRFLPPLTPAQRMERTWKTFCTVLHPELL